MNAEQFLSYLQNNGKLYTLNYQEIKSLVVQYPYCQSLRVMLLQKSIIEPNKDHERNLQLAAAYTTDRRKLYRTVQTQTLAAQKYQAAAEAAQPLVLNEDHLELAALSNLENVLAQRHVTEVFGGEAFQPDVAMSFATPLPNDTMNFDIPNDEDETLELILSSMQTDTPPPVAEWQSDDATLIDGFTFAEPSAESMAQVEPILAENTPSPTPEIKIPTEEEYFQHLNNLLGTTATKTPMEPRVMADLSLQLDEILSELHTPTLAETEENIIDAVLSEQKTSTADQPLVNKADEWLDFAFEPVLPAQPAQNATEPVPTPKPVIELEITDNGTRISEATEPKTVSNNVSFGSWLQQFSMKSTVKTAFVAPVPVEEIVAPPVVENGTLAEAVIEDLALPEIVDETSTIETPSDPIVAAEKETGEKKRTTKRKMPAIAQKSIVKNNGLASETLAKLLELQGKKVEAIEMYKQLSLQFPEKSAIFALRIEHLRNMA